MELEVKFSIKTTEAAMLRRILSHQVSFKGMTAEQTEFTIKLQRQLQAYEQLSERAKDEE